MNVYQISSDGYLPPTMFGPIILMLLSMFGLNPGPNGTEDRIAADLRFPAGWREGWVGWEKPKEKNAHWLQPRGGRTAAKNRDN